MDAVTRAYESVKARLLSHVWTRGERLPTIAQLAEQFSVSKATMWKTVALLKKEELLSARRGGLIVAGPPGMANTSAEISRHAWMRVKIRIGQDILRGVFKNSQLPPIYKMALNYGAAIDTIKKALTCLAAEGLLVRVGRSYRQVSGRSLQSRTRIILVSQGDREQGVSLYDFRTQELVKSFERECHHRAGYQSFCEGFNPHIPTGLLEFSAAMKTWSRPAGYMVNMWGSTNPDHWQRWLDLLRHLAEQSIPVVVIDQAGDLSFPADITRSKWFRILRIAGERAGEMVAECLVRRGHTHVSFITPFLNQQWAQNRYNGLCRYYKQYGGPDSRIDLFALSEAEEPLDLTLAVLDTTADGLRALFRERYTVSEIENMVNALQRIRTKHLAERVDVGPISRTIQQMVASMLSLAGEEHHAGAYDYFLTSLLHVASNSAMDSYLRPFFQRVFDAGGGTAWVCAEDKTSVNALAFLKSKKKRVPRDISIIGFNNWDNERELQLSSYDFNMDGFVLQALTMIMDEKTLAAKPLLSEVDGYVVERKTTRR